jgi:hypothetical protein
MQLLWLERMVLAFLVAVHPLLHSPVRGFMVC